jgi:predicted SnoaL-like aldol condensation-catalyzing enzyme
MASSFIIASNRGRTRRLSFSVCIPERFFLESSSFRKSSGVWPVLGSDGGDLFCWRCVSVAQAFSLFLIRRCCANAGDVYHQHDPGVGDGKETFIAYVDRMAKKYHDRQVHFKRAVAENDYVALHCFQRSPEDHDYDGIDTFRLDENGRIVEHWDVL